MSAPVATGSIPVQRTARGAVVSIQSAPYYPDADAMATKSYSATGLPTGLSINTTTGEITGTPTVGGTYNATITCTTSTGPSNSYTLSFVVAGVPAAAQEFFINGVTGSDSYNGLSATHTGGSNGPWLTIPRANSVQPHASGHVDIWIATGTYRGQLYEPQYSGTNDAHRIRLRVFGSGTVEWLGPSSGYIVRAFLIGNAGWEEAEGFVPVVRNYISILRESATTYFHWDGEVVFGSGSLLGKGEHVESHGHLRRLGHINGAGVVIEGQANRTVGWNGLELADSCTDFVARIEWDQHGTSFNDDGADYGDMVAVDTASNTQTFLIDGGANGRSMVRGGHSAGGPNDGTGEFYRLASSGKWSTLPTFGATDGNRCFSGPSRNSRYVGFEQCTLNGNGYPPDNSPYGNADMMKFEGRNNIVADSVLLDAVQQAFFSDSASWSGYCDGARVCHTVFQNFGGMIVNATDWEDGVTPLNDMQYKNCIFDRIMQNELHIPGETDWRDLLFLIWLAPGTDWRNVIQMHGCTIRDQTRTASQMYLYIVNSFNSPGLQPLQWFIDNHPANFSNITVTTSELFTNPRAFGTYLMPPQIPTYFTPVTTGNGVPLTTVAATDSGSGTSLVVNDATWFRDPRFRSEDGTTRSIHCNGANRQYTAINKATRTLTMATGFSRSPGMAVNRTITSGSTPNRGAVR